MTEKEIEELEKAAALKNREAGAREKMADATAENVEQSSRQNFAPQMGSYNAEQERFRLYRANATRERMDNINRHPENYNYQERRTAAKYAAEEEAKRQFDKNDDTRNRESLDKRDAMIDQGRGAAEVKAQAEKDAFGRMYGSGENYRAEQDAARKAEIEKARVAGVEAAKAQAEGLKAKSESDAKISAGRDAASVRVAEENRKAAEAKAAADSQSRADRNSADLEKTRITAQSRVDAARIMSRPMTEAEQIQIGNMKRDPRYKGLSDDRLLSMLRTASQGN